MPTPSTPCPQVKNFASLSFVNGSIVTIEHYCKINSSVFVLDFYHLLEKRFLVVFNAYSVVVYALFLNGQH